MKSRFILILTIVLLLIALLAGCNGEKTYTISFEVDGIIYESLSAEGKGSLTMPKLPTKEGYIFEGWFFDKDIWGKELTKDTLSLTPISSDTVVYAKWSAIPYTVTFESNGGSGIASLTKFIGENITAPTQPIREGYTFKGWFIDNNTFLDVFVFDTMPAESLWQVWHKKRAVVFLKT